LAVTSLILLGALGFDAAHAANSTPLSMTGLQALYAFAARHRRSARRGGDDRLSPD
jgi:hypothetical protein